MERELLDKFTCLAVSHRSKAKAMLQEHPELLGARDGTGETALHYLAIENNKEAVRFLCQLGSDVNTEDSGGESVLTSIAMLSSYDGYVDMATTLLELGADPNASNQTTDNPLHQAASHGCVELVELLLKHGANGGYTTWLGENIFDAILQVPSVKGDMLKVLDKHGVERRRSMHDLLESGDYSDDPRRELWTRKDED